MAEQIQRVKYQITGENLSAGAFNEVKTQLSAVTASANNFKAALAGVGITALFGAIDAQATGLIKAAAALDDLSEKTGASVGNLSKLQQVAKIGGHDFEGATDALVKFSKALAGTDDETKGAGRALEALGLSAESLRKLDPGDAITVLAKRLNEFQDSGGKTALILELLGKSGAKFLPFLKDLATEGGISAKVTAEQAAKAEELEKALKRLSVETFNAKQALALSLVPSLVNIVEQFNAGKKAAGDFISAIALFGTINPFKTPGENLASLRRELDGLQVDRARQLKSGPVDVSGIDLAISSAEKRIEFLKSLQRQEALAGAGADTPGERARFGIDAKGDLSGFKSTPPPKLLQLGPKNEEADQILKLNRAVAEAGLGIDREINQQRLAALEQYNSASLVSIRDYYRLRQDIAQTGLSQELRDIDAQSAAERARIDTARRDFAAARAEGGERGLAGQVAANQAIVDAETRLIKLQAERGKAQISVSGQLSTLSLQEKTAVDNLAGAVANLNAQLQSIRGDNVGAALSQFDEANRKLRQELTVNRPGDVGKIDDLREQLRLQEEFNRAKQVFDDINSRLAISEERIAVAQKTGAVGELRALTLTGNARREAVAGLQAQLKALEDIAATSDNPRLPLLLDQTRLQIEKLASETDVLGNKFRDIFTDAAVSPLVDFITHTKSAGDAFRAFTNTVLRSLNEIAIKSAATELFGKGGGGGAGFLAKLFGGSGSAPDSSLGGSLGDTGSSAGTAAGVSIIGSLVKGLFGGSGSASDSSLGGSLGDTGSSAGTAAGVSIIGSLVKGLFGFAQGGSFDVGGSGGTDSQLVAFRASPNERVIVQTPAQQAGSGSAGAVTINQVLNFGSDVTRSTMAVWAAQVKSETIAAVANSRQRGGSFSAAVRG